MGPCCLECCLSPSQRLRIPPLILPAGSCSFSYHRVLAAHFLSRGVCPLRVEAWTLQACSHCLFVMVLSWAIRLVGWLVNQGEAPKVGAAGSRQVARRSLPGLPPPAEVRRTLTLRSLPSTPNPAPHVAPGGQYLRQALSQQPPGLHSHRSAPGLFTQVTGTCSLFVSTCHCSSVPPKRQPQRCVPRAPSLSFHPPRGLLAWCQEAPLLFV